MTGERLGWHVVASHLHVPVEELKARITTTEFLDWLEFLKWDESRRTKQDIYLAQIAAEVRRGWVKDPKKVRAQDFLLREETNDDRKNRMQKSKSAWLTAVGIKLEDK